MIVEVLVVPELHQSFRKIRLYPWRINTEPLIEAVAPTFELTLFINFRTILLVDSVGNITKLDNAAWCDLLLLQLHNVSLVPCGLIIAVDKSTDSDSLFPLEYFLSLGLELSDFNRPSVQISIGSLVVINELEVKYVCVDRLDAGL